MSIGTVISAFSAEQVGRITGLTSRQLGMWDATGFFKPTYSGVGGGRRRLRTYSFTDVVGLRVLHVLRTDHKISLQKLRRIARELARESDKPWSNLKVGVCQGDVVLIDETSGRGRGVLTGQSVLVPVIDQIRHVRREAASLSKRQVEQIGSKEQRRNVAHNAMVVAGTRVPVRAIRRFLSSGYSIEAVLNEYPSLQRADIEAIAREQTVQAAA